MPLCSLKGGVERGETGVKGEAFVCGEGGQSGLHCVTMGDNIPKISWLQQAFMIYSKQGQGSEG